GSGQGVTDLLEGARHLSTDELDGDDSDDGDKHDQEGVLHHAGTTILISEERQCLRPKSKHVSSFRVLRWRACGLTIGIMARSLSHRRGPLDPFAAGGTSHSSSASPRRMASMAAWVRSLTASFWKIDARWFLTVFWEMKSNSASSSVAETPL